MTIQGIVPPQFPHTSLQSIRKRALDEPEDSKEMFALIQYMDHAQGEELERLKAGIAQSQKEMGYLLEKHTVSQESMDLSAQAVTWPVRILPAFDENAMMLENVKSRTEQQLVSKREKLLLEIEKVSYIALHTCICQLFG